MTERWYALRSKPHKYDLLWEQLRIREIETFYPRLRVQTVNPRARKIRPCFPGYVFVRVDLEQVNLSSLQWTPGRRGRAGLVRGAAGLGAGRPDNGHPPTCGRGQ